MDYQSELLTHLKQLAYERDPFLHPAHYFFARQYLIEELQKYGTVTIQRSPTSQGEIQNIILELPSERPERSPIILGAHYDTVPSSPGADDNASGLAVLLVLAQTFSQTTLTYPVRLIAFGLEEYGLLGSQAYVEELKANNAKIKLMLSLEMLGYITQSPNSQKYPPGLQRFYPDQGNFIALIGNLKSIRDMRHLRKTFRSVGAACEYLPVPFRGIPLPITRRSDHAPFWDYGAPAMMMTDTADLRNPHYHQPTDTIETLDIEFMEKLVTGLTAGISTLR